jgi:hypothetical protein
MNFGLSLIMVAPGYFDGSSIFHRLAFYRLNFLRLFFGSTIRRMLFHVHPLIDDRFLRRLLRMVGGLTHYFPEILHGLVEGGVEKQ